MFWKTVVITRLEHIFCVYLHYDSNAKLRNCLIGLKTFFQKFSFSTAAKV